MAMLVPEYLNVLSILFWKKGPGCNSLLHSANDSTNMPELVCTSLMTLFPDSLSATIDLCSFSFPNLTRWSHSSSERKPLYRNILQAAADQYLYE